MNFRGWSVGSFWAKQYSPNWYLKLGLAFEGYQYDGLNQSEMNPLFQAIYHLPEKLTLTLDGQQKLLFGWLFAWACSARGKSGGVSTKL